MCDTMVALGNVTKSGSLIFAKNSDRDPNEPHLMIRIPRSTKKVQSKVMCTYIEVDQADHNYEVLLLKPSWMWGAEMGINEHGLKIGNEAVFTREKYGNDALTGMDMLRLALVSCKTSSEALEFIIYLLGKYGQGGNCGYKKKFTYHNSFLIADNSNAYVLETAGQYWIYEKVKDVRCISNRLTIGKKYDACHPGLIDNALKKGYMKKNEPFDFARHYQDPLITQFSGSLNRFTSCSNSLLESKGHVEMDTMKKILRSHDASTGPDPYSKHSLKSVCMHGGFIFGDHTTGSFISEGDQCILTGASTPCLSVFKPFSFSAGENLSFREEEHEKAISFWLRREVLHRMVIENRVKTFDEYLQKRNTLEDTLNYTKIFDSNFINDYFIKEKLLVEETISANSSNTGAIKGNPYFKYYWKKKNSKLLKP